MNQAGNQKWTTIRVSKELRDQIKFCSKMTNKSMHIFLSEIFEELLPLMLTFKNTRRVNIEFDSRVTSATLFIYLSGATRLYHGIAKDDEEMRQQLREQIERNKK